MANNPLSGNMPAHLRGRSQTGGPFAGAYMSFNIGINTVAAAQTDLEVGAVVLPFAFKVTEVGLSCTTSTGGATRGTIQITDGTNDLLTADTLVVSAGSARISALSTGLVAAQRVRAAADRLQVDVTTPASEVITALNVVITGYVIGHNYADSAND